LPGQCVLFRPARDAVSWVASGRLIPVRVGDVEIEVQTVPVGGTEATSGGVVKNVTETFTRAQDAIIEIARSTADMIERAGKAARPDRVELEFGLSFSASGGVIMVGVSGEATLKVTLGYDPASRSASMPAAPGLTSAEALPADRLVVPQ